MSFRNLGLVVILLALLCGGCWKGTDEKRFSELLTEQEEQSGQMSQISKKVDSVDERLSAIEKSINVLAGAAAPAAAGKGEQLVVASNFASTKEYQDIMRQIGVLQERVATSTDDFNRFNQQETENREREALRDPRTAFRAMSDPAELSKRLDLLVKNSTIRDRAARSQFANEIENLKAKYSTALSPEQKREQARASLAAAVSAADNDRARGWMEGQLKSLDEAQNSDEASERVDRILQMQRMREIGELTRKYNIPEETVRDAGLVSFDRGGPPGFGRGRGGD